MIKTRFYILLFALLGTFRLSAFSYTNSLPEKWTLGSGLTSNPTYFLELQTSGRYLLNPSYHKRFAVDYTEYGNWTLTNDLLNLHPNSKPLPINPALRTLRLEVRQFPTNFSRKYTLIHTLTATVQPRDIVLDAFVSQRDYELHDFPPALRDGLALPDAASKLPTFWRFSTKSTSFWRFQSDGNYGFRTEKDGPWSRGKWSRTNDLITLAPNENSPHQLPADFLSLRFFTKVPSPKHDGHLNYLIPSSATNFPPYNPGKEPPHLCSDSVWEDPPTSTAGSWE